MEPITLAPPLLTAVVVITLTRTRLSLHLAWACITDGWICDCHHTVYPIHQHHSNSFMCTHLSWCLSCASSAYLETSTIPPFSWFTGSRRLLCSIPVSHGSSKTPDDCYSSGYNLASHVRRMTIFNGTFTLIVRFPYFLRISYLEVHIIIHIIIEYLDSFLLLFLTPGLDTSHHDSRDIRMDSKHTYRTMDSLRTMMFGHVNLCTTWIC
jgi:hypothetical protein